jgi:hypothetical protein
MQSKEDILRIKISMGWLSMLAVVIVMLVCMIYASIFEGNAFKALYRDPSPTGIVSLQALLAVYALMPLFVYVIGGIRLRALRWLPGIFAILMLLYFGLHHAGHTYSGDRPTVVSHLLDVAHHLLAIWVVVNSIRWAKLKPEAQ